MNKRKIKIAAGVIIIVLLLLCGLFYFFIMKKKDQEPGGNTYTIYYKNTQGTELTGMDYEAGSVDNTETLVWELLNMLQQQKADDPSILPAVPSNLKFYSVNCDNSPFLVLDVSGEYEKQENADEILCRAALVMTLTQIEGVDYVEILMDGQPITDSNKRTIGKMSGNQFMTELNGDIFSRQKNTVLLYFINPDGKSLKEVERTVLNDASLSMEKMVMTLLMAGPMDKSELAPIPKGVSLQDITIKTGTCYVNFDSTFLKNTQDFDPNLIIYSIVNTLSELPDVNKVQISVNGSSDVKFKEMISLSEPFVKDMSYVYSEETMEESESEE